MCGNSSEKPAKAFIARDYLYLSKYFFEKIVKIFNKVKIIGLKQFNKVKKMRSV
jgi:hypothetical protein